MSTSKHASEQRLKGIVVGGVPYGERSRVVNVLTDEEGLVPVWVANARTQSGLWHPLALVERTGAKPGRGQGLWQCKEWRRAAPQLQLRNAPERAAVAFFVAECLALTLEEHAPAPEVFALASRTVHDVETAVKVGWVHVSFTANLVEALGLLPAEPTDPEHWFSIRSGEYVSKERAVQGDLSPAVVRAMLAIRGMEFAHVGNLKLTHDHRRELVLGAFAYAQAQLGKSRELKSYEVLEALFS